MLHIPAAVAATAVTALSLLVARVLWLIHFGVGRPLPKRKDGRGMHTLIVLGSGGHTAEMLNLLAALDLKQRYSPRSYVAGATDSMSLKRAQAFEEDKVGRPKDVTYTSVYRSREVGQSYVSSVFTTLAALVHAAWVVVKIRPDLILCNGPGTCLPICIVGFVLRVLCVKRVVLIYVESVARVEKLSLTGLILHKLRLCDQFIVQWPELLRKYPRTLYIGRLM